MDAEGMASAPGTTVFPVRLHDFRNRTLSPVGDGTGTDC